MQAVTASSDLRPFNGSSAEYHTMHIPLPCHTDLPYEPAGYHYGSQIDNSDLARLQQSSYMTASSLKDPQRVLSFTNYGAATLNGLSSKIQQTSPNSVSNPYMRPENALAEESPLRLDFSDSLQMPMHLPHYGSIRQTAACFGPQLPLEPFSARLPHTSYGGDSYSANHQFFFISKPSVQDVFSDQPLKSGWSECLQRADFPCTNTTGAKTDSQISVLASYPGAVCDDVKPSLIKRESAVVASDATNRDVQQPVSAKFKSGARSTAPKFQCNVCGKQYCRRSTLKAHLRQHSGERPYLCGDCGKRFSQAANLTAHRRVHTGEKPFSCPICCRPFSQSSSLVTHKRTHTGERPYSCNDCDKAFTDSSTLTKHMRIHTGMKPYVCSICMLRFSQSGNLNRHMKTHSKHTSWPECC